MYKQFFLLTVLLTSILTGMSVSRADYAPAKVVYDISSALPSNLANIFDRVGLLQNIYNNNPFEASIILVIHEGAIPLFAKAESGNKDLMKRANSFVMGEIIQFRICRASAKQQGFDDQDFHEFIQMVPMADAEIIQLQNSGYAYLH